MVKYCIVVFIKIRHTKIGTICIYVLSMECMSGSADVDDMDRDAGSASDSADTDDSDDSAGSDSDGEFGGGETTDGNPIVHQGSDCNKLADLFLRLKDSHEPRVEVCNSNGATGSSTKRLLARLLTLNA